MSKVNMSAELPVAATKLWELVGGFNALPDWHPAVEKSELEDEAGTVRKLTLAGGGGTIIEKLLSTDDNERVYSYSIVDSPLPVKNYHATIKVRENPDGSTCVLEWSSEFDPAGNESEAINAIQGVYQAGFDNLKKLFGMK